MSTASRNVESTPTDCLLCRIDAHGCSDEERCGAYFIAGDVRERVGGVCNKHIVRLIMGAAALGEIMGKDTSVTRRLRAMAEGT